MRKCGGAMPHGPWAMEAQLFAWIFSLALRAFFARSTSKVCIVINVYDPPVAGHGCQEPSCVNSLNCIIALAFFFGYAV